MGEIWMGTQIPNTFHHRMKFLSSTNILRHTLYCRNPLSCGRILHIPIPHANRIHSLKYFSIFSPIVLWKRIERLYRLLKYFGIPIFVFLIPLLWQPSNQRAPNHPLDNWYHSYSTDYDSPQSYNLYCLSPSPNP